MRASTKRALSLLTSAALLIASLFIYTTFIQPEYDNVILLRGTLAAKSALLDEQQKSTTQAKNLIAQYQSVAKASESLSLALPNGEAVSSLMLQLNALSQLNGVGMQSVGISYLPIKPSLTKLSFATGLGTLQIDLRLSGSYGAFKQFLQALEKNIRIMNVKSFGIQSAGKPEQDIFIFNLVVDAYYQPK